MGEGEGTLTFSGNLLGATRNMHRIEPAEISEERDQKRTKIVPYAPDVMKSRQWSPIQPVRWPPSLPIREPPVLSLQWSAVPMDRSSALPDIPVVCRIDESIVCPAGYSNNGAK